MEASEALKILLSVLFMLAALLGVLGLLYKVFIHLSAVLATPTYAAMIMVELFSSGFGQGRAPRLLRFSRPTDDSHRIWMDFCAFMCTALGAFMLVGAGTPDSMLKLVLAGKFPFIFTMIFLILFAATYIFSYRSPEDKDSPLRKLEKLGMPQFLKNLISKAT